MQLTCSFCNRQFSRREHLTRHLRSHVNERSYECGSCGNRFNRCDLLNRHRKQNCSTVTRDRRVKQPQTRNRSACDQCAKAKVRCSPSDPCSRCQRKNIPCVRKSGDSLTDSIDTDDMVPGTPPHTRTDSVPELECQQDNQGAMAPSVSLCALPQTLLGTGNGGTEASPREIHAAQDPYHVVLDWPFESCTPPQGLSMDFLDLSTFPVNGQQVDMGNISEPHLSTAGEDIFANDSLVYVETPSSPELPDRPHSWHKYSSSGMVQMDLWSIRRPLGPMEPGDTPRRAEDTSDGPQGLPKSMLNLLTLEDILEMEDYGHVAGVRQEQVEQLASFMATGRDQRTSACPPNCDALLRNTKIINSFVQLYFEHFHQTFPILHRATFNVSEEPPLLMLAVATIGGRFSKIPQAHRLSTVMGDILRKTVENVLEENIDQTIQISFAQAAVLNQIQTAYHGSRRLALKAQFQRAMLVTVCRGINSKIRYEDTLCETSDATPRNLETFRWLDRERSRRLTYGIWLVDLQFSLNASVPPMMSLDDVEPYLPCHETEWDLSMAELSEILKDCKGDAMRPVRLKDALETLRMAGTLPSRNIGLFARYITMTAVFYQWHTVTSVDRCILQSADDPAGQGGLDGCFGSEMLANGGAEIPLKAVVPAVHRSRWRRAAFEAMKSICENTTAWPEGSSSLLQKLRHHISILLLVPLQPMCDFIGWMGTEGGIAKAREGLCDWIRTDTQNARRAVMHAIALFSLVRKRKSTAHSENHHLFLGFLTIWTFFSLDPVARPRPVAEEVVSTAPACNIDWDGHVDLDAQERWISAPGHPSLRIVGVGSLEEPSGLHRILVETHRLFLSDRAWGISRLFAGVLEGLVSQGAAIGVV
ncbi:fungal-specific transcription factor domain-containing protein [Aspergillus transmontanensis]|uniref:Fungal-specific transcription factor domain-containing protein n=1 Tax=Aspergillus transmontanensis TaxID=1034304 RepID=A0A5N6VPK3_9EURO|nr:fungal-specific transcription factor domain-containing protein [Aspergillus transmontanensis]